MTEAVLGVAAVARRLGVATGTLRTWDRRYGLGPTEHEAGSRRRYTAGDLARLEVMRQLMLEGVSPADAAREAIAHDGDEAPAPGGRAQRARTPRGGRSGGGRVVPLRNASPAARGLARAAMSLDADSCTALLVSDLQRRGVVETWNDTLLPVLAGIGERWRASGAGIEVEHLLSESAEVALRTGARTVPPPSARRPVLLAGLEQEDHRLALVALAAALGERAVPLRMLGVRLPVRALADAMARTGPSAVFLWSQGARGPGALPGPDVLASVRPRPALVLGGPGYADGRGAEARGDDGVAVVDGLAAAVSTLVDLAAGPARPTGRGGRSATAQQPPATRR